jgi:hypothetical protein
MSFTSAPHSQAAVAWPISWITTEARTISQAVIRGASPVFYFSGVTFRMALAGSGRDDVSSP